MANKLRNEVDAKFGSKTYKLRATMEAIAEIEDVLDMSIPEVVNAIQNGKIRLHQLRTVFCQGVKASGGTISDEQFSEGLEQSGLAKLAEYVMKFCLNYANGAPTDPEKKEQ